MRELEGVTGRETTLLAVVGCKLFANLTASNCSDDLGPWFRGASRSGMGLGTLDVSRSGMDLGTLDVSRSGMDLGTWDCDCHLGRWSYGAPWCLWNEEWGYEPAGGGILDNCCAKSAMLWGCKVNGWLKKSFGIVTTELLVGCTHLDVVGLWPLHNGHLSKVTKRFGSLASTLLLKSIGFFTGC